MGGSSGERRDFDSKDSGGLGFDPLDEEFAFEEDSSAAGDSSGGNADSEPKDNRRAGCGDFDGREFPQDSADPDESGDGPPSDDDQPEGSITRTDDQSGIGF